MPSNHMKTNIITSGCEGIINTILKELIYRSRIINICRAFLKLNTLTYYFCIDKKYAQLHGLTTKYVQP